MSLRFVLSRVCVLLYSLGPGSYFFCPDLNPLYTHFNTLISVLTSKSCSAFISTQSSHLYTRSCLIGSYRENAIASESEAGDSLT